MLDFTSLSKAIAQLETSLRYARSEAAKADGDLFRQFRSASIQAFEFTYELSWKSLKRYLEATSADAQSVDALSFPDLIRTAAEAGLLASNWDVWKDFRYARSVTSHTYDAGKADEVFAIAGHFLAEAKELQRRLEKAQGHAPE